MGKLKTTKRACAACGGRGVVVSANPEELKTRRTAARLTQEQMAQRLGCSTAYISHVELGRRSATERIIAEYAKL